MGRKATPLTAIAVAKLKKPGLHFVGHVDGLALHVSAGGAKSWILRVMVGGRRRDIGLGPFVELPLGRAREVAAETRQKIRAGVDPVAERKSLSAALKADQASFINFDDAAKKYIAAHEAGWKNLKHAAQWRTTVETYANPVIGKLHVKDVSLAHILKILEPLWSEKTETASRLRGRIEAVLDWSIARGMREGPNPARWKGNLDVILPARSKVSTVRHQPAMAWHDIPAFIDKLRSKEGVGARALEFAILTATRSGEVRGAVWEELDLDRGVWVIPAKRMKAGKEHRIPLSEPALALLQGIAPKVKTGLVFPSSKDTPLSDMTLTQLLRRMQRDCTVHGFRSTFRDWAGESSSFPREVIEHALAHQLKDKAEAAYARGDLFVKRTRLMKAWADYLSQPRQQVDNVRKISG